MFFCTQAVTLEHIPRMVAPDNSIASAPQNFSVWALESLEDEHPVELGSFRYLDANKPVQTFQLLQPAASRPYDLVELKVASNHGNLAYTCLYRFRVHGKLATEGR